MPTFSDYIFNSALNLGLPGIYVGLVNNATAVAYKSGPTGSSGLFTQTGPPPGIYTLYTSPTGSGLPPGGDWVATGDANYLVPLVNGAEPIISRASPSTGLLVKPLGDGSSGLIDWIQGDTTGYLFHLTTSATAGGTAACIGIGVQFGGTGLLIHNYATGAGFYLQQDATASTAYGMYGRQFSSQAPLIHLDQNTATDAPLISLWGNPSGVAARLLEVFTNAGVSLAGYIAGSGEMNWLAYVMVGNYPNPTTSTPVLYNQSGVGPTLSGNQVQVRTGATPATRLTIDGNGVSVFTGALITTASVAGASGFNVPHGTAPTSPVNGDIWSTTAGLFCRINGVTKSVNLT